MSGDSVPTALGAHADALSDRAFRLLAEYIYETSGIKITLAKKGMLEGRLRKRVRQLGLETLERYCRFLFEEGGLDDESTELLDAVTTNKTDFFREPHHFHYLLDSVLPEILEQGPGTGRPVRIWSAGCSSGAEPYTIAMVCELFADRQHGFRYDILATDLCTKVLQDAVRAIYPHDMAVPIPMALRHRFLLRSKTPGKSQIRIAPELRKKVRFRQLNLMERHYPIDTPMDVIFCRNLLIYFDRPTQKKVLEGLCRHLKVGGYLMLGHSENISDLGLPLRGVGATVYQREG